MTRCPWTGRDFQPVKRGAHEKKFASTAARAEAHKAARLYTEAMIENGFLTWEALRRWYANGRPALSPSYTTAEQAVLAAGPEPEEASPPSCGAAEPAG